MSKETPPTASNAEISHDLLDSEAARSILKMPQAKFELLVSSGQLPIFRSNGGTCFRREDIAAIALKRQGAQAKPGKARTAALISTDPARDRDTAKYSVTRETLSKAKSPSSPKPEPRSTCDDEKSTADVEDTQPTLAPKKSKWDPLESTCRHASLSIL